MKPNIAQDIGHEKVAEVVNDFYDRVQLHPTLSIPFGAVEDWKEHKEHLTHFWWVTLGGKPYRQKPYRVAEKHELAGFTPELLVDWIALFQQTLQGHLPGDRARQWLNLASHIGRSLTLMHEFRKNAAVRRSTVA